MDKNWLERTELLIQKKGVEKLKKANILVVGLGGVGSFAAEFICRSGIGNITIIDGDTVDVTNINRQLPALHSTENKPKVELVGDRLKDINPELNLTQINEFLNPDRMSDILDSGKFDYIIDCIDSLSPKVNLLIQAKRKKIKAISCMGAGGKMDPSKVKVRDLHKTSSCFLAKNVRKRLKKENINKGFRCVFSTELPLKESIALTDGLDYKRSFYGTISYMPALFGLYAASEVINYLLKKEKN